MHHNREKAITGGAQCSFQLQKYDTVIWN